MTLRVVAHGGGVQSTALLVLSAQGKIDFPTHLFCNVGDDSEHPATLAYVHDFGIPYATAHGIDLLELRNTWVRTGEQRDLLAETINPTRRTIPIPLRGSETGSPGARSCTMDFKVTVISRWLKAHGATKAEPATVAIGISVDEIQRAKADRPEPSMEHRVYPLLDLGLRRSDCYRIIAEAGLPKPPKSSCYFCPFHRPSVWAEMARDEPELFEKACQAEDDINAKLVFHGKERRYLTRFGKPLRDAIGAAQDQLFSEGSGIDLAECDEGVCFV